jgi:hypothetical protein
VWEVAHAADSESSALCEIEECRRHGKCVRFRIRAISSTVVAVKQYNATTRSFDGLHDCIDRRKRCERVTRVVRPKIERELRFANSEIGFHGHMPARRPEAGHAALCTAHDCEAVSEVSDSRSWSDAKRIEVAKRVRRDLVSIAFEFLDPCALAFCARFEQIERRARASRSQQLEESRLHA